MPSWNRGLRPVRVVCQKQDLDVQVEGSIRLEIATKDEAIWSENNVSRLITNQHVWIARTGTCTIAFSVLVDGECVCGRNLVAKVIAAIRNCTIWARLGIRLRYSGDESPLIASVLPFAIHQIDAPTVLSVPSCVTVASFRNISYIIHVSSCKTPENVSKKRKRRGERGELMTRSRKLRTTAVSKDEFYDCLNAADKQAIDEFVLKLGLDEPLVNVDAVGEVGVQERLETDLENLVSAVIHTLVLGTARQASGYKSEDIESANALVKVAPGVFHVSYIRKLSEQLSFVNTISSSLTYMKDAESAALRRKVAFLGELTGPVNHTVEYAVWRSLIENFRPPALAKAPKAIRKDDDDDDGDSMDSLYVSKIGDLLPTEAAEVEIGEPAQLHTEHEEQADLTAGEQSMPASLFPELGYECGRGISMYAAWQGNGGMALPQMHGYNYYPGAVYSEGPLPIPGHQMYPGGDFYVSPMQTRYGHLFE